MDAVAFSPDGRYLATGCHDQSARVFDLAARKQISQFKLDSIVDSVAFSPDGHRIATGSYDNTARVFNVVTGKEISRIKHDDAVNVVAFSPDGNFVASGGQDKIVRVFEAATGKQTWQHDHSGPVIALAFTSDGRHLLTSSSGRPDKSVRMFDAKDGREVSRLVFENAVSDIVLEQSDSRFVTVSRDPDHPEVAIGNHPLDTNELIDEVCKGLKRNTYPNEWKHYLQDEPYQQTCPT